MIKKKKLPPLLYTPLPLKKNPILTNAFIADLVFEGLGERKEIKSCSASVLGFILGSATLGFIFGSIEPEILVTLDARLRI